MTHVPFGSHSNEDRYMWDQEVMDFEPSEFTHADGLVEHWERQIEDIREMTELVASGRINSKWGPKEDLFA